MLIELEVTFRVCEAADLPALEWIGLYTTQREIIAEAFADQQRRGAVLLLADAGGFPVGQVWLDFSRRGTADCPRLWALRVFPPMQGAGLGRALMQEAEVLARRRGASAIDLGVEWSNPRARALYGTMGYRPIGAEREVVDYAFDGQAMRMDVDQEIMRKPLMGEP